MDTDELQSFFERRGHDKQEVLQHHADEQYHDTDSFAEFITDGLVPSRHCPGTIQGRNGSPECTLASGKQHNQVLASRFETRHTVVAFHDETTNEFSVGFVNADYGEATYAAERLPVELLSYDSESEIAYFIDEQDE